VFDGEQSLTHISLLGFRYKIKTLKSENIILFLGFSFAGSLSLFAMSSIYYILLTTSIC